ncbi:3-phosphoinositide-dependent protein kinase 1-like [Pomacea canaliculata]|uniref:3-phosphoinositide-dependent protein kinase 1-like n=1 Tax=Pomacea canaliculata TaxID=400727 RepID=UPI000D73A292|nr:3-phosphoinositide-dependent protein kinase 1-like [Pomacea canaliculata]
MAEAKQGTEKKIVKKTPHDFIFGKFLGEGSFSTVTLAKEVSTGKEFAIKVCNKQHLIRERKSEYAMREKAVLTMVNHPFIIKLFYTFQDVERLYFVLEYTSKKDLSHYLKKLSSFDLPCSRFYAAEIVEALDYLQNVGIIHRDLKPENILLRESMHIMITDFGSAKILKNDVVDGEGGENPKGNGDGGRRKSFVGTAQYVTPEVLASNKVYFSSDLWALGCIIYEFLAGKPPFYEKSEYKTFKRICSLQYDIPACLNTTAQDLVSKLLVLEPEERLGSKDMGELRAHPFFEGIVWEGLPEQQAPQLLPYLPATETNPEMWSSQSRTGLDDQRLAEIIIGNDNIHEKVIPQEQNDEVNNEDHQRRLQEQAVNNEFHEFVQGNLIIKQGKVLKRRGLFARKRMLLLTEGPHLYYVDYANKVLKGEIPWSSDLRPEAQNFRIFFVHTPNRTYYLESRESDAHDWVKKINEVWQHYFGNSQ